MLIMLCVHVWGGMQVRWSTIELEAAFSEQKRSRTWIFVLVSDLTKTESLWARCQRHTWRVFYFALLGFFFSACLGLLSGSEGIWHWMTQFQTIKLLVSKQGWLYTRYLLLNGFWLTQTSEICSGNLWDRTSWLVSKSCQGPF